MFRVLAVLAAVAPAVLASVLPGESCGYFGYATPEPSALAVLVHSVSAWAARLLPVVLASAWLWLPRRFPVLGAAASGVVLLLGGVTFVVPYTSVCGTTRGVWVTVVTAAVATAACVLARRDAAPRPIPPAVAAAWTAVLALVCGRYVSYLLTRDDADAAGCFADLKGAWALWWMRLDDAEAYGLWVGVAALGCVLVTGWAARAAAVALLVPALYVPAATLLSGVSPGCSGLPALVVWPYVAAAAVGVLTGTRRAVS
ncbi:hypothetical protein MF672_019305 [Actinomadura sp. ATCC 31491]|uniref:Integral membrane protein n=1 Tax=Actinomadura luzonensis TaxID=2805427 RepID=A0ABT0FUB5_9ACTN|nr:hypothetical protein [Actinomadura luzonensis]MCK2215927.1 hypothetical protein [Actinomadura luzonensis]